MAGLCFKMFVQEYQGAEFLGLCLSGQRWLSGCRFVGGDRHGCRLGDRQEFTPGRL